MMVPIETLSFASKDPSLEVMPPFQPPCLPLSSGLPLLPPQQLQKSPVCFLPWFPPSPSSSILHVCWSVLQASLLRSAAQEMKPHCTLGPFPHLSHPLVRTSSLLDKSHAFLLHHPPHPFLYLSKEHLRPHPDDHASPHTHTHTHPKFTMWDIL